MTSFENFHSQFRGLVERAMLSEIEDMLRILAEALRPVASDAQAHVERAAEALHAARRRERTIMEQALDRHRQDHELLLEVARNRIDVPRCAECDCTYEEHVATHGKVRCAQFVHADEGGAGNLPV